MHGPLKHSVIDETERLACNYTLAEPSIMIFSNGSMDSRLVSSPVVQYMYRGSGTGIRALPSPSPVSVDPALPVPVLGPPACESPIVRARSALMKGAKTRSGPDENRSHEGTIPGIVD